MLLCGLCVNSLHILFWDLCGFLPFCLSSGEPGISLWDEDQCHFVYRKERQREKDREGEGRWANALAWVHILSCTFEWHNLPECYTNCTTRRWVRRQQRLQSLQSHRWSVRHEPQCATLTGHPNPHPPSLGLPLTWVQLPGLWTDVIIVVFRAENRNPSQNGLLLQ